ncbi:MAG: hypothetical protein R3F11_06675 [Verrucomicrobiales bacterium]
MSWHLYRGHGWLIAVLLGAAAMMVWDLPIIDPLLYRHRALRALECVGRNLAKVRGDPPACSENA